MCEQSSSTFIVSSYGSPQIHKSYANLQSKFAKTWRFCFAVTITIQASLSIEQYTDTTSLQIFSVSFLYLNDFKA